MADITGIIKRPLVNEKTTALKAEANKVVFVVNPKATKGAIKQAVESAFDVTVLGVTTMNVRGKHKRVGRTMGQRPNWKKAIVTLAPGDEIDVLGESEGT